MEINFSSMKKLYFLSIISLLGFLNGNAQTYYPVLDSVNEWSYTFQGIGIEMSSLQSAPCNYPFVNMTPFKQYTAGDTIIDSLSYKIAMNSDLSCVMGYLREDTAAQKVYFIDNAGNPEIVLYDFSMQVGDTIPVSFLSPWSAYTSGNYILDAITTMQIGPGQRRVFHLSNHNAPGTPELTWIESVGNPIDMFYPYSRDANAIGGYFYYNCPGVQHQFDQFLICFRHVSLIYLDSCSHAIAASNPVNTYYVDSCNYNGFMSSIGEEQAFAEIGFSPNPANAQTVLALELKKAETVELFVYDVAGKKTFLRQSLGRLPAGKTEMQIDLPGLPDGCYLAEVRTKEGSVYCKLIVQR
jgi:hypothetical protein